MPPRSRSLILAKPPSSPKQDPSAEASARGAESERLRQDTARTHNWKRWGPYLSERQWGTVREDYSADGSCWTYLPHEHARSRVYRWGEDGLLGITDRECRLCFALALWNGRDPILKERLFGLSGPEGNHGEDVKEAYFYLDSTPTHSSMKALYKYPQAEFPYARLVEENGRRERALSEFELADTGVFDGDRYFDVVAEYAKAAPDDILIRITATNRGPDAAPLVLLPTLWYRNTWCWGSTTEGSWPRATLAQTDPPEGAATAVRGDHLSLGKTILAAEACRSSSGRARPPRLLFTDNETNTARLFGTPRATRFVKDAFHDFVIAGDSAAVNPAMEGTKAGLLYRLRLAPGASAVVRLRLQPEGEATRAPAPFGPAFEQTFAQRQREADEFYNQALPAHLEAEPRRIARQAWAGLLWSKQFYHYVIKDWLEGDPAQPPPPAERLTGRNSDWGHLFNRDVILMPDKWEYPWYAAWDLAFHCVALARIDPELAKSQLVLFLREWYMHHSGQIPAYEFAFGDVNPPVHAWACWRVYKMTGKRGAHGEGGRDRLFLARAFQKLLINFTWWVNRKDPGGKHIFSGGFLGLDNIGVFDRSQPLPSGILLEQADGTAWMAFYCATMLAMALELAIEDSAYDDVASKFFEHFVAITDAMNHLGGAGLWSEEDGFYYDQLRIHGATTSLRLRSMVGIIPLFAVEVLEQSVIDGAPGFKKRMQWFLENRKDLGRQISYMRAEGPGEGDESGTPLPHAHRLLAIPSRERLERTLRYVLDESEFLSPRGVRSLSRAYRDQPYTVELGGQEHRVEYAPGESTTPLFGGNSNWRGPVWFPVNYLLIESLERYHHFFGDSLKVECPTGSGHRMNLAEVAGELRLRLGRLFLPDSSGRRPCHGDDPRFAIDPHWRDLLLFHEYFHGETGKGLGASHQTGWTALIATLLCDGR